MRQLKKNIVRWQNPLKIMANRNEYRENDNLKYGKKHRNCEKKNWKKWAG